jgi:carbonic anhydrase
MLNEFEMLVQGYAAFRDSYFNGDNALYEKLAAEGQKPKILMIACSDSRVDPAIVLGCQPGDLFVVRNVANLVPPCERDQGYHGTSAALEFGIKALKIQHVVLFGHTRCGGIQSLFEEAHDKKEHLSFIEKWMGLARPAYEKVQQEHAHLPLEEKITTCEQYSLLNSLENLMSFEWIQKKVEEKHLFLHAWYFDIQTGLIYAHDPQSNDFKPLVQETLEAFATA